MLRECGSGPGEDRSSSPGPEFFVPKGQPRSVRSSVFAEYFFLEERVLNLAL